MAKEVFVSVDIEADGPIPGINSMLNLGAAAYDQTGKEIDSFEVNIEPLPDAIPDPDTLAWWKGQGAAWDYVTSNTVPAQEAMEQFSSWLKALPGKPVFVAYPASYDFLFAYWYIIRFTGHSPFGFAALDIKTLAWAYLGGDFRSISKRRISKERPGWLKGGPPHDHTGLSDARGQGAQFLNMVRDFAKRRDVLDEILCMAVEGPDATSPRAACSGIARIAQEHMRGLGKTHQDALHRQLQEARDENRDLKKRIAELETQADDRR